MQTKSSAVQTLPPNLTLHLSVLIFHMQFSPPKHGYKRSYPSPGYGSDQLWCILQVLFLSEVKIEALYVTASVELWILFPCWPDKRIKCAATNNIAATNDQSTSQGTLIHQLSLIIINANLKQSKERRKQKDGWSEFNLNFMHTKRVSAHYGNCSAFFISSF